MKFQKWTRSLLVIALLVSALSLTTPPAQAAGQAQTVDPKTAKVIWCPVAVTIPTPNKNDCTDAFSKMSDLVGSLMLKNPAKAGTIWIGMNYLNTAAGDDDQVLDGANLTNMTQYPLTIKGGWKGLGTGTLNSTRPSTFDGASVTVQNWAGNVTLLNLLVKNATAAGCSIPAAVCVGTAGKIKLDRVWVIGSSGLYGAYLDSTISVSSPPGSVTVTNSQFLRNGDYGLYTVTNGAVTLKNVIASQNASNGAYISNTTAASPVTVTGAQFYGNEGKGLEIYSQRKVTLTNLLAQSNLSNGTYVDNRFGSGDVLLNGTNTFLGNDGTGLYVSTNGNVSADQLAAHDNYGYGVEIRTEKAITISGRGLFTGNGIDGLHILAVGPIIGSNLTAISNTGGGLFFQSFAPGGTQAITLNKPTTKFNKQFGIVTSTAGKATLSCGTVYGNAGTGLSVIAAALKLQGFRSSFNGIDETFQAGMLVVRTACPTP